MFGLPWGKVLAYCIAGHHTGLANGVNGENISSLEHRLKKIVPRPDPAWQDEIEVRKPEEWPKPGPRDPSTRGFCAAFLTRMVFSALVDADFLDTEAYYADLGGDLPARGRHPPLDCLAKRLDRYLQSLGAKATPSPVNALREEILTHVRGKAGDAPGLFTLTVPTGGGKTLTSLAFALDHAIRHGHSRVIYVIPYMSIVEQTAAVFRDALRETNDDVDFVLEHHSTFDEDRIGNREARNKLRLAMENWDVPIVVTTAVQFFESLFANRPSKCRKLHNISNSVIILDEAQTLPLAYLRPCLAALDELARNWQTSVVLCTATQPALARRDDFRDGLVGVRELAPDPARTYQALKRTRIVHCGTLGDADLAERLRTMARALCIVNTQATCTGTLPDARRCRSDVPPHHLDVRVPSARKARHRA